ncbi:multicopper oxidase family protein [Candidatus Kaiserbacteria bacterium]|nr:multicopper oxidase family protein [Candidatus Kaiserbacteria bacterium]
MTNTSSPLSAGRQFFFAGLVIVVIAIIAAIPAFNRSAPLAKASEIVELKNGDTYDLVMDEVTKEINGTAYAMLAYNGSIPGPLIKIAQGAEVTINFKNKSAIPTMLHSHGVRMDNAFDGSQSTQKEIPPSGSFTYVLKFPDAGMYWYHPHVRDDYAQELGAYGQYLVVPEDENYWPPVNREVALFLDDILIEDGSTSLTTSGKINISAKKADRTLMGRFGNVMLINGEPDYVLNAQKGEVVRLYLTNAANTRPFNFAIPGTKMKLVGGDSGAYEKAQWVESVLIGPSERATMDVLVTENAAMVNQTPDGTTTLGTIAASDEPIGTSYAIEFNQLQENVATKTSIDPFRSYFTKEPDKRVALTVDMMGTMAGGGHGARMMTNGSMMGGMMGGVPEEGIEWDDSDTSMMNHMSNADSVKWNIIDQGTGKKNMDIDWTFKKGEPVKIRITNDAKSMHPMQHPIHFHGQRFLVVSRDGVPQRNLVWKDTVLVKAGETVDIILDTSNPGTWMAHCHILEHIEAGMMLTFKVE